MRSSNPIFRSSSYNDSTLSSSVGFPMTISGTMTKLLVLAMILLVGAGAVLYQFSLKHFDYVTIISFVSLVVCFILAMIISFKPNTAPYLSPIYAFAEGAFLSSLSCFFEFEFPGIVVQAISLTMIVVFTMAFLFKIGAIKATEKFRSTIFVATCAIAIFYVVSFVLSLFGIVVPYFTVNTPLTIGINIIIAGIAALNLIIDFDFIDKGSQQGLPKVYEWYGAFGLLVTIVWLYVEILKLLSRFRNNN